MDGERVMVEHLKVLSAATNYHTWMYRQIVPYIGQRILEVGAGIGNFTSLILDRELVVATDKYRMCVECLSERYGTRLKVRPFRLDLADPGSQLDDARFDTVICLNVLAHIEDDERALRYMASRLVPQGRVIVIAPALQFLYGSIDRVVEHHRRYTRKELSMKMSRSGLKVERAFYMNALGMAGWFFIGRILREEGETESQINFTDRFVVPLAERLERLIPPPLGLSVVAVGRA